MGDVGQDACDDEGVGADEEQGGRQQQDLRIGGPAGTVRRPGTAQLTVQVSAVPGSLKLEEKVWVKSLTPVDGPEIAATLGATFVPVMLLESEPLPPSSSVTVRLTT